MSDVNDPSYIRTGLDLSCTVTYRITQPVKTFQFESSFIDIHLQHVVKDLS